MAHFPRSAGQLDQKYRYGWTFSISNAKKTTENVFKSPTYLFL